MIYLLFSNGASVVPLFLPFIPQLALVLWVLVVLSKHRFHLPLPAVIVIICFIFFIWASLFANVPEEGLRFGKLMINAFFSILVAAAIKCRYRNKFADVYAKAMLIITLLGIIGLLFAAVSDWHITSYIENRQYNTNLITTWLVDRGFNSSVTLFSPSPYRLQAMFDEPGTFSILLVPAFFHYIHQEKFKAALLLLVGAFLSESANAWLLCSLIIIWKAFFIQPLKKKILLWTVLIIGLVASWPILVQLYEVKSGIDVAYENVNSFGVRSIEYSYLWKSWEDHIFPLQSREIFNLFPSGISVAYVTWYINGGMLFIIIFLSVFISLALKMLRGLYISDKNYHFSFVLGATLLLSGFQRSSFLDNVLFMSLTFWAISLRSYSPSVEVES